MGNAIKTNLGNSGFVEYEFDKNSLNINSVLNVSVPDLTPKLYIRNSNLQKPFLLGSFYKEDGLYKFNKTYSLKYLDSNNLLLDTDYFFEIDYSESNVISCDTLSKEDKSLKRAKEVLDSLKDGKEYKDEVFIIVKNIKETLKLYQKIVLPFKSDFDFYEISDIKENFSLTSVEHIIYTQSFVRLFVKNNMWYFGVGKKHGQYCVCIKSNSRINPMENTKDCAVMTKGLANNEFYFLTGILLSDDGQYFCKIDNI